MKILILGAGKMGSFFTDLLSFDHEVAVLERDPKRMRFIYNAIRMQQVEEVKEGLRSGTGDQLRNIESYD